MDIEDIEKNLYCVRKIVLNNKNVIYGLIISGKCKGTLRVVTANGGIENCDYRHIESINRVAMHNDEAKKQYELIAKKDREIKTLNEELKNTEDFFKESCEELKKIFKLYDYKEFKRLLVRRLMELGFTKINLYDDDIYVCGFALHFSYKPQIRNIEFLKFVDKKSLNKCSDRSEYDFIREVEDGHYFVVNNETEQYKNILKKSLPENYFKNVFKNVKGYELTVTEELDIGDGNMLNAYFSAFYDTEIDLEFSDKNVEKIAGIIKEIFG